MKLVKLPFGTQYRIEETAEDYSVSVQIGDADAEETNVAEGTLEENTTVAYTNDRVVTIPTGSDGLQLGVTLSVFAALPLLTALLILNRKKRKERA